jgi:aminopeptidase N
VIVEYRTGPEAAALQWLEPAQTTSGRLPFLFTQSEAIHARSWIPCIDSPGARVTYDATVHVPPGMTAVMSAEAGRHDPAQGVFRFRMTHPIPTYLIALAAGEIAFESLGPRTGVYAEPAVLKRAAHEFADMEPMLAAGEALNGHYAWGRWDLIVLPPSFPYGGMENPRLTFVTPTLLAGDRSLVNVVVHELAHSWLGNLVTNATWGDFWLNEGFTNYGEARLVEALYGAELADMQTLLALRELRGVVADPKTAPADTRLALDLAGRDPDDGPPSEIAYDKGASFLRVLEARFGRPRLDRFLRRYFAKNAFQSISTARFLEQLRRDLFADDERAWQAVKVDEWVHGTGIPDNVVVPQSPRFEAVGAVAAAFLKSGALDGVHADWSTIEWQEFLGRLPEDLPAAQLAPLEERFHLSEVGNSEVLFAWLQHVVRSRFAPGYPALEGFLTRQGRRKFVKPLFEAMAAHPETKALARRIYEKTRPRYHPIVVSAVDAILK